MGGPPKWHHFLYTLTLPNINRFAKLFYCQNHVKICNDTITEDPVTSQVCRYITLRNVTEWDKLLQRFIDRAIGQWRRRLECVV